MDFTTEVEKYHKESKTHGAKEIGKIVYEMNIESSALFNDIYEGFSGKGKLKC